MNKARSEQGNKTIALNKKARRDYFINDRIEAGLCLQGWEVKSPRAAKIQIIDSYILLKNGKACLFGALISPLPAAAKHVEADLQSNRKLLPHRAELNKLIGANPVWSIPAMRDFHDKAPVRRAGRPDTSSLACLWRWLKRPARAKNIAPVKDSPGPMPRPCSLLLPRPVVTARHGPILKTGGGRHGPPAGHPGRH